MPITLGGHHARGRDETGDAVHWHRESSPDLVISIMRCVATGMFPVKLYVGGIEGCSAEDMERVLRTFVDVKVTKELHFRAKVKLDKNQVNVVKSVLTGVKIDSIHFTMVAFDAELIDLFSILPSIQGLYSLIVI
jgi:hypothetical protein